MHQKLHDLKFQKKLNVAKAHAPEVARF